MRLACNTVLFAGQEVEEALRLVREAGYTACELASIPGMAVHLDPDGDVGRVRRALEASRLHAVAVEAATDILIPQNRARVARVFAVAASLGVGVVTTGSSGRAGDEASWRAVLEAGRQLAEAAARAGVVWAVKPHVGAAVHNTATAFAWLSQVGQPSVGVNLDPTHLLREGDDPVRAVHTLAGSIRHVHLRDTASRDASIGPPEGQVPGRGRVDLAGVAGALAAVGYRGHVTFEVIGARDYPVARQLSLAAQGCGYLRCLLAGAGLPLEDGRE